MKTKAKQTARKEKKRTHKKIEDREDKTREGKKRREAMKSASWLIRTDKRKIKKLKNI